MASQPISAVDAVTPAFERAKRQLFQPFRLGYWARIALLALLTGEFTSTGGCNGVSLPSGGGRSSDSLWLQATQSPAEPLIPYAVGVALIVGLVVVLVLVALYLASVFRFVLFETVISGEAQLRTGWTKWQGPGVGFLKWQLVFVLVVLAGLVLVVSPFISFSGPAPQTKDIWVLLAKFGTAIMLAMLWLLLGMIVGVLAKDFLIPLMALEGLGPMDATQRVIGMVKARPVDYLVYLLMKAVLAVGAAMVVGIVCLVVLLVLLIPVGLIAAVVYFVAVQGAVWVWTPATIALAVIGAVVAVAALVYLIAFIGAPVTVFFVAYSQYFFAGRYEPLYRLLYPAAEPPTSPPSHPLPAPV